MRKEYVRTMPSDFAPVSSILAAEREQGQPVLEGVEGRAGGRRGPRRRQVLRDTRQAWQDGYERRESRIAELA